LKEEIVTHYVKKWLQEHKQPILYENQKLGIDFLIGNFLLVTHWAIYFCQIECKGTKSDIDRAVGQCLRYHHIYDSIPTYLAIPKDYRQLRDLQEVVEFFELPIGILLVDNEGKVTLKRKAKGKRRIYKFYQNEIGHLVNRVIHPKLHFKT
jgi:hypothetical protein